MVHEKEDMDDSIYGTISGNTPLDEKLFYFDGDQYYITVEKRGYASATRMVNEQSACDLKFDLVRIAGVEEETFDPGQLSDARFYMLPVDIEVLIHSGVGALDKRERSEFESLRVSETLNSKLRAWLSQGTPRIEFEPVWDDAIQQQWRFVASPLNAWITTINAQRLPHYSRPLIIEDNVEGFAAFMERIEASLPEPKPFLVYIHGRCISETSGRIIGNAFFSPLATMKFGSPQSAYASDTGTKLTFYVIDPRTYELLHMENYTFPHDATDQKRLDALVEAIGTHTIIQPISLP